MSIASLSRFQRDLDEVSKTWLKREPVDLRRRELAAFALEAAFVQAVQGTSAGALVEWGCRQIRRISKPDEFEHRWHLAAFAAIAGAVDPDSMQSHVAHVRFQFPSEPRLPLERAIASEQSASPFFTKGRVAAAELTERNEEAAKRFKEVTTSADPALAADAWLHLGHVEAALGRLDAALAALAEVAPRTTDRGMLYLTALFRGQVLERQGQSDAARESYQTALGLQPGAHAASMALATLLFRTGDRVGADRIIAALLSRTDAVNDPWWMYGPAEFRYGVSRILAMREALK